MKRLKILIAGAAIMISIVVNAQSDIDALRYSMIYFGGTARYSSMGGAFGAVGADFSTLSTNPAGLGVYRKNEITFTPSVYAGKTSSVYNGKTTEDMKYNFNLSNFGMVYALKTNKRNDEVGWKSINIAFGLNRYNNFHNRMNIEGQNNQNSMMTMYLDNAQGVSTDNLDPFSTELAFNTHLIDTLNGATDYICNVPNSGINQRKTIETKGAMQEMVFALGANYNNKLFIGGTFGFPYVRYLEQSTYKEMDSDTITDFKSFTLNEDLTTTGSGFNFKFGLIYVPVDIEMLKVKIGAAVHTPTFFAMHDEWSKTMKSSFENGNHSAGSPQGSFDYQLTTPMRVVGSIAFQIGQYGTISADYEFVDYSEARLRSESYKYFDENDNIQAKYTATNNIRIGAEAALGLFSLRGGYAIYGSPYKSGINDGKKTAISGGFGIIDKDYFIDFGYVYSKAEEDYYLYNSSHVNPVNNEMTSHNFLITLGLKF
ncbi:MAG: hypothetical protein WC599_09660 [Bacteroidales bacterium]